MPYAYTNRRGETHYFRRVATKKGGLVRPVARKESRIKAGPPWSGMLEKAQLLEGGIRYKNQLP